MDWRHGAHREACVVSALLHVGKHKRNQRRPLLNVWPDLQNAVEIEIRAVCTQNSKKEKCMSKLLQRGTAMLAVIASLVFCSAALAQMPINPWKKAAPFPQPDEELYGAAVNGKM